MTEDPYSQFLDEFGRRLRQAGERSGETDARRRHLGGIPRALAGAGTVTRARVLLAAMACAGAAAVVALLVVPGTGSSSYLARAAAAMTSPGPDTVLYESWQATSAIQPSPAPQPDQLWVEDAAPRNYRLIMQPRPVTGRAAEGQVWGEYGGGMFGFGGYPYWLEELEAALAGHPLELGGELENPAEHAQTKRTFTFTPPNTLWSGRVHVPLGAPLPEGFDSINESVGDPVTALREAITEGRAREDGTSEFDGQTVERIAFNLPKPPAEAPPPAATEPSASGESYALVDSETFRPVEVVFGGITYTFLAYEYLPATPANLALANIQAQHPEAQVIPDTPPSTTAQKEANSRDLERRHLSG